MNVITGKLQNKYRLAVCIFPSDLLHHQELKERMISYTEFYCHRMKQIVENLDIIKGDSIDSALEKYQYQYDHILFVAAGVRFFDESVIFDIDKEIQSNPNYMAAGHILEWKDAWYELHHQFVLVNLSNWTKAGKPIYGSWTPEEEDLIVIERSQENFHDDYTPLWIKSTGQVRRQRHCRQGWNFIDKSLKAGFDILNWNQTIRNKRTYYYPETQSALFYQCLVSKKYDKAITNYNQQQFLNLVINGVGDQIWALNSEHMNIRNNNEQFETVALPASGFKFLDIIKSRALKNNGLILFYDFNQKSLDWITHIYQSDSLDIKHLIQSFPYKHNLIWRGINNPPIIQNDVLASSFLESLEATENYFGGHDKFVEYIIQFRKLNVKFLKVDLINNPYDLITEIGDKKTLLHISNIFSTDYINAVVGLKTSNILFEKFKRTLHQNTKLVGHSPRGETIR